MNFIARWIRFEIKYRINVLNFANVFSRRFDYENDEKINNICFFTLQNKLKNVIVVNINLFIKNDFIIEKIKKIKSLMKTILTCEKTSFRKRCLKKNQKNHQQKKFIREFIQKTFQQNRKISIQKREMQKAKKKNKASKNQQKE